MEAVLFILTSIIVIVLVCFAMAALGFAIVIAILSVWALVKPHLSGLIDAWLNWFERRMQ